MRKELQEAIIDAIHDSPDFYVTDLEEEKRVAEAVVKAVALGDHGLMQYLLDSGCLSPSMENADWPKIVENFLGRGD